MLFLVFLVAVGVILAIVYLIGRCSCGFKHPKVVRAKGLPLIGNALDILPATIVRSLSSYPKLYGQFVEFYVLLNRGLLISDVESVREILAKRPKKFMRTALLQYASNTLGLGEGLFHAEGNTWMKIRKATAPSFSSLNVTKRMPSIGRETLRWIQRMQTTIKDNPQHSFDMKYEAFTYTIATMTLMAFGMEPTHKLTSYFFTKEYQDDTTTLLQFSCESLFFPLPMWVWKYTPYYQYELKARAVDEKVVQLCQRIIDQKREYQRSDTDYSCQCMMDSMIFNSGEGKLTDSQIISNTKVLYLAGIDTTAVTITWVAYYFSLFPEYVQRIRDECREHLFHDSNPEAIIDSLDIQLTSKLVFCQAFLKEILRLCSPAAVDGVEIAGDEPVVLSNGIVLNPKDMVWPNIDGIHRNPDVFEDPERFYPERWLISDEATLAKMENSYIPFGSGPRICPGLVLAMQESLLAVSLLSYYFDFSLDCPQKEIIRLCNFVSSANKMPIRLKSINH